MDRPGSLGEITRLDARLTFNGQKVRVADFETNGTLLALQGNGDYNFATKELLFNIQGQALKDDGLVSWVFSPLSWLFEVQLYGTADNYKWYFPRSLKGWFRDKAEMQQENYSLESLPL